MATKTEELHKVFDNYEVPRSMYFACVVEGSALKLVAKVERKFGSQFNMAVDAFLDQDQGQLGIKTIDKTHLDFYIDRKNNAPTNKQYKLSAPDDELKEYYDDEQMLTQKLKFLAKHIKASKDRFVVYTGAGISTSASIPDFRGPNGAWTRRDRNLSPPKSVTMEEARPTYAHMCLVKWQEDNTMTYLVSQNVDGLHRRSGIRADKIAELHGNCFKEICASCNKEYLRTFDTCDRHGPHFKGVQDKLSKSGISHITGRKCDGDCGGMLRDSIIHFSESLPKDDLENAIKFSNQAKLRLCVGTSLRVTPAADLPVQSLKKTGGIVVIVNLQQTGKDLTCLASGGILIHERIDRVFEELMLLLGYNFPNPRGTFKPKKVSKKSPVASPAAKLPLVQPSSTPKKKAQEDAHDQKVAAAAAVAKAAAPPAPQPPVEKFPLKVFVGNTHRTIEGTENAADSNTEEWTMFVSFSENKTDSNDVLSKYIESVEYNLHPTFHPKKVTVTKPPFALSRFGWGVFDVTVVVKFKNRFVQPDLKIVHRLKFNGHRNVTSAKIELSNPHGLRPDVVPSLDSLKISLKPTQTRVTTVSGEVFVEKRNV